MGQVTAMKRGSTWQYRFEGAMIDGKRKRYTKGGFRTKAEALEAGNKAKAEYDNTGVMVMSSNMSLSDYMDYWLEHHVKGHLSHETYIVYEVCTRVHIKPTIGNYRLSSISAAVVQKWVDDNLSKLSESSMKSYFACLSGALKYAVHPLQYLKVNPCSYVRLPKIAKEENWKDRVEYVLSSDDWKSVQQYLKDTDWLFPIQLMYHTGMRVGECCALDLTNDVDFKTHKLTIRRQMRKEDGKWIFKAPKYNSIRTIYMGATLEKLIRQFIAKTKENSFKYGEYYQHAVTPCHEDGSIITPRQLDGLTLRIRKNTGLEYFHMHSLRHTHGTMLAQQGASPKTIMERLGHKDIKMTMERYVTNTEAMQEEAARLFESAL